MATRVGVEMSRTFWSLWKARSVGLDQDPVVGGVLRRLAGVRWAGAAGTFPTRRSCWLSPEEREEGWERREAWVEEGGGGVGGANERSSGQRWAGHHWAERSEDQGGSWVSCRGS